MIQLLMIYNIMNNKKRKNFYFRVFSVFLILFCCCFLNFKYAKAEVKVGDDKSLVKTTMDTAKYYATKAADYAKNHTWTQALMSAGRTVLHQVAYQAAVQAAWGGSGQKPSYYQDDWGDFMNDMADNAAGQFIENMGTAWDVNLCQPNLDIKIKIGLGLSEYGGGSTPNCSFSTMRENWSNEIDRLKAMDSDDFLQKFQGMFDPTSNDLGIALTLQTGMMEDIGTKVGEQVKNRDSGLEWDEFSDSVDRKRISPPQTKSNSLTQALESMHNFLIPKNPTTVLGEMQSIFVNTLALEAFKRQLLRLTPTAPSNKSEADLSWLDSLEFDGEPLKTSEGSLKSDLSNLLRASFSVKADYNILNDLATCPNLAKAGPTNCVIDEGFRQAIESRITLGDAIDEGYLSEDGLFGFSINQNSDTGKFESYGNEPSYVEGFPYRSMLILRKYRIIPVGWELAAQYIDACPNGDGASCPEKTGQCSLGDMVACYSTSDKYTYKSETCNQGNWCRGLVDPSWVLKAPLNYCAREGYGPVITFSQSTGEDFLLQREDGYCADEQMCILENADGSCEKYGYCLEEKRKWVSGEEACDAKFNSCQTFADEEGQTFSYLENTLDFGTCDSENAGCESYVKCLSTDSVAYDASDDEVDWDTCTGYRYLTENTDKCDSDVEGCTQFIRLKSDSGVNILENPSAELPGDPAYTITSPGEGLFGNYAFEWTTALSASFPMPVSQLSTSNVQFAGETYTFSFYSKNCGDVTIGLGLGNAGTFTSDSTSTTSPSTDDWKRYTVTHTFDGGSEVWIDVQNTLDNVVGNNCLIDGFQLERGRQATTFSEYRERGVIQEKVLPEYLADTCYVDHNANDFQLKTDAPDICSDYARRCNADEEGCNMYTSVTDGMDVPAKVTDNDICPSACVGYDEYLQMDSYFDSVLPAYFIPSTAKTCTADVVGCDEFTNLDKINQEGEAIKYYSYLRQCIKPDDPAATCSTYYTWEGSAESGFQLRLHNLQRDILDTDGPGGLGDGDPLEPAVVSTDYGECNLTIYTNGTNPDCREFYDQSGNVSYHLYSKTITCADNCYPLRKSNNNIVTNTNGTDMTQAQCEAISTAGAPSYSDISRSNYTDADPNNDYCVFCKNGGTWNAQHGKCIYSAIPSQGKTCGYNQVGCRSYSGNSGNITRPIVYSNFEGTAQGWISGVNVFEAAGTSNATIQSVSLMAGEESLEVSMVTGTEAGIGINVNNLAETDKAYVVRFLAKAITATEIRNIGFCHGACNAADNRVTFDIGTPNPELSASEWQVYEFNLPNFNNLAGDYGVDVNEILGIVANGSFYIDDIELIEISDRYYVVSDSWQTPNVCYYDVQDNYKGPTYNLGCDQYVDREDDVYYLHSFSKLCQESAVGCELVIETDNYDVTNDTIAWREFWGWNGAESDGSCVGDGDDCVMLDSARASFIVYDEDMSCLDADIGCERLGIPSEFAGETLYKDIYLLNNPNNYDTELCLDDELNCKKWGTSEGYTYFKDPGSQTCEWRQRGGTASGEFAWLWSKVKRCGTSAIAIDNTMPICNTSDDCAASEECLLDDNDYDCEVQWTTLGQGGENGRIFTPGSDVWGNWVGLCPASQSGCTEYIDPMSQFATNLIGDGAIDMAKLPLYDPEWYCSDQDPVLVPCDEYYPPGAKACPGDQKCIDNQWRINGAIWEQKIILEAETFYRIAANNATTNLVLDCPSAGGSLMRLDENSQIVPAGNSRTIFGTGQIESEIIYSPIKQKCQVTLNNPINGDYVEVKKLVIEYQLDYNLDKTSCNGVTDNDEGCIMFNEREVLRSSIGGVTYNTLTWNTDLTPDLSGPTTCSGADCNSNLIAQVQPDRECGKWLDCEALVQGSGNQESTCLQIGVCDKFNDIGGCDRFVDFIDTNQTYSSMTKGVNTAGDIKNMTGYVKVGYQNTKINDFSDNKFHYGAMSPYGEQTNVHNGGFELINSTSADYDSDGDPDWADGWDCVRGEPGVSISPIPTASSSLCELVDDLAENAEERICFHGDGDTKYRDQECLLYAPDGENYIKLTADSGGSAVYQSSNFNVATGSPYVLSYYVNTIGLTNGRARVYITYYDDSDNLIIDPTPDYKEYDARQDWKRQMFEFIPPNGVSYAVIWLYSVGLPRGLVYFDAVNVKESLSVHSGGDFENEYAAKDCRLFPTDDALSCDYRDDENIRYKGWDGYCMEWDRYPGYPFSCLMWWSIPHSVDSINAWCGDDEVADEEDCECPYDAAGDEVYSCDSQLTIFGTDIDNQYTCNSCMWTGGWCGDNYVDTDPRAINTSPLNNDHIEECDHNDGGISNLTFPNFGYEHNCVTLSHIIDNASLGYIVSENEVDLSYHDAADGANPRYVSGALDCYDSTNISNMCTFDKTGCSEELGDVSAATPVTLGHTANQCLQMNDPGVREARLVVERPAVPGISPVYTEVIIETDGSYTGVDPYIDARAGTTYPVFCRIDYINGNFNFENNPSTLDNVCQEIAVSAGVGGGTAWQSYNNWSATGHCLAEDSCCHSGHTSYADMSETALHATGADWWTHWALTGLVGLVCSERDSVSPGGHLWSQAALNCDNFSVDHWCDPITGSCICTNSGSCCGRTYSVGCY